MKQKRAEHNSPLKARKAQAEQKELENKQEKGKINHIKIEEAENAMLIKQLVTHFE